MNQHRSAAFAGFWAPYAYDAFSAFVWLPTSRSAMRRLAIDRLGVRSGQTVLELGAGTGGITEELVSRGARVVALDRSQHMLARARRRVPSAEFVHDDLRTFATERRFDWVLFAFVLHELGHGQRVDALRRAAEHLVAGGRVAVIDHASPAKGLSAALWTGFLKAFEPPPVVEIVRRGFKPELAAAGLELAAEHQLAGARVRVLVAEARR